MNRLHLHAALFVCALPTVLRAQASQPTLALQHVNVVDVRAGRVLADQTVIVEGKRITNIGPANSIRPPAGANIINGNTKFLIPGLWDMHVHAAWAGLDSIFAPLFVANGVTDVREMFGALPTVRAWKTRAQSGEWPHMIASSHILDGPRPIWPTSATAGTPEEARRKVDSLQNAGADFIKVYNRLPRDAYRAAIDEAKRLGTYVAGHVPDAVTVAEASDLGQRTIEHLTAVSSDCSSMADTLRAERVALATDTSVTRAITSFARQTTRILATRDPERCAALIARLARNHTWQVPTLVVLRSMAHLDDGNFTADARRRFMPEAIVTSWNWRNDFRLRGRTPDDWANAKRAYQRNLEIVGEMRRAGVSILAGTDVLNPFAFPGFSLHDELALLVQAGLTPTEALRAATLNPAVFLNATDSLGTVEKNKRADLVLLDANPLTAIQNTQKVNAVVLNGRFYNRTALDSMIAYAERKARPAPR
jgi:imidazolonepropionase-like amidohydrolase